MLHMVAAAAVVLGWTRIVITAPRAPRAPPPRQVAEMATQIFITNDRPNVAGLVMAGSADFKNELSQSELFDARLQAVVLGVVDVSYGERSERGFGEGLGRGFGALAAAAAPACARSGLHRQREQQGLLAVQRVRLACIHAPVQPRLPPRIASRP